MLGEAMNICRHRSLVVLTVAPWLFACAGSGRDAAHSPTDGTQAGPMTATSGVEEPLTPGDLAVGDALTAGLAALDGGDPVQAILYLGRVVRDGDDAQTKDALLGLADAHVALRDYTAAARVHASLLARGDLDAATRISVSFAKGALEAELGEWEASAADYARALELAPPEPSRRVEALVRRGFALFQLDRLDEARAVLADADREWGDSQRDGSERFPSLYFVAMGRFYQAAVLHRRFLEAPIRLPMAQMKADFDRKLELLDAAQRAYNETIAVKHPYWVSAAGYQLGELFERFYVDVSRSPVPVELDAAALRTYERELDAQLRPAIEKAMWVHEQNLAAARRLGYATEFVERSERALARLRSVGLEHGDFRALLVDGAFDPDEDAAGAREQGSPRSPRASGKTEPAGRGDDGSGGGEGGDPAGTTWGGDLGAAEPPYVPPMRPL